MIRDNSYSYLYLSFTINSPPNITRTVVVNTANTSNLSYLCHKNGMNKRFDAQTEFQKTLTNQAHAVQFEVFEKLKSASFCDY